MKVHIDTPVPPEGEEFSGYYPLTKDEVRELLNQAKTGNVEMVLSIHVRLLQGMKGSVIPSRPDDEQYNARENKLSYLYLNNYEKGATDDLVEQLFSIMENE